MNDRLAGTARLRAARTRGERVGQASKRALARCQARSSVRKSKNARGAALSSVLPAASFTALWESKLAHPAAVLEIETALQHRRFLGTFLQPLELVGAALITDKARQGSISRMAQQQPAAPTLKSTTNGSLVRIEFDVPSNGETHAAVHLHEAGGATRMYDAASKKVLPAGEKGRAVTLKEPEESGTPARKSLFAAGLEGGTFEATVAFRRADDFDWGPTSPRSAPLVRAVPVACGAPLLEPVSSTEMRVHFAVPQGCASGDVCFYEDRASVGRRVACDTCTLMRKGDVTGNTFAMTGAKTIVVKGLSSRISYTVEVSAHNGIGWGPWSPPSTPMKLRDFLPPVPSAPVVDQISSDSARVFCAVLPTCTHATVTFVAVDTGIELAVDHGSGNKLVPLGTAGATASPRVVKPCATRSGKGARTSR